MNRIEQQILNAAALHGDKSVVAQIREAVVPKICSKRTWYMYLKNKQQPSIITANKILGVLKVWLPKLTLQDLVTEEEPVSEPKFKLVKP